MPADFLTLRGEQTKLLIKRPATARTAGGAASDRVPFTIYQLFLTAPAAEGFPTVTYSVKITVLATYFLFYYYSVLYGTI